MPSMSNGTPCERPLSISAGTYLKVAVATNKRNDGLVMSELTTTILTAIDDEDLVFDVSVQILGNFRLYKPEVPIIGATSSAGDIDGPLEGPLK